MSRDGVNLRENWTASGTLAHIERVPSRKASWAAPLALLAASVILVPLRMLDAQGLPRYRALKAELVKVKADNATTSREVRDLARQVEALKTDPAALERVARDELGMVREGEIVFQFGSE